VHSANALLQDSAADGIHGHGVLRLRRDTVLPNYEGSEEAAVCFK
jgi:hypothetical protein